MPGRHPAGLLRVERDAIPAVRAAVEDGLTELTPHIRRLQDEAMIRAPWLGDKTSAEVVAHYKKFVIDGGEGPLTAMLEYQAELTRILENLKAAEDSYPRADGQIAGGFPT